MSRIGLLFRKVGSSTRYYENGKKCHVTVLHLEPSYILDYSELEEASRTLVAFGDIKESSLSKALQGVFKAKAVPVRRKIMSFSTAKGAAVDVGVRLSVSHFVSGQYVDVVGQSIGKGFAGVMKRHNFAGLRASHGVSKAHRSAGSTGGCQDPGRVWKGKKMAGRMGGSRVTVKNLMVVDTDMETSILTVKGAVPGSVGGYVLIMDAKSRSNVGLNLPFPIAIDDRVS